MWMNRWIIEWRERGRGDEALETATTAEEALEICRRFLENETAFDDFLEEDRPAFDVLSLNAASSDAIELGVEALQNENDLLAKRDPRLEPREFLEAVRTQGAATCPFRGLLHVLIGRRVSLPDGTAVSEGMTWREAAADITVLAGASVEVPPGFDST